jgi:predicted Zn-ribbon and HTH transcriptional regulator
VANLSCTISIINTLFQYPGRLKEKKISDKISVEEVYYELSKVEKIIERNGRENIATIPKREKGNFKFFRFDTYVLKFEVTVNTNQ